MAQGLKERIGDDVKAAMRAKDKERLAVLRQITAAIKQREVDERSELDDDQVLGVIEKLVKQHRDSIQQYGDAGRDDLVQKEQFEVDIIQEYLPEALDEAELDALIDQVIAETGASSPKEMGQVMGALKPKVQGRADMGAVGAKVKARLAG
ncbi:MAG TPA: GatB/YqeY domain-containing protein [Gammaproteobacteria bacterium]|nr:GatB/YqeY domain-containing protein [Gammaproteobacteria bacterium]